MSGNCLKLDGTGECMLCSYGYQLSQGNCLPCMAELGTVHVSYLARIVSSCMSIGLLRLRSGIDELRVAVDCLVWSQYVVITYWVFLILQISILTLTYFIHLIDYHSLIGY